MGEKGESKVVTSIFILRNLLTQGTMCPDKEHCESHCVGEGQDLSLNVLILRCQLDMKKGDVKEVTGYTYRDCKHKLGSYSIKVKKISPRNKYR